MVPRRSVSFLALALAVSACDPSADAPAEAPAFQTAALDGDSANPFALAVPGTASNSLAANTSQYYRLTVPANHDGLRVALICSQSCNITLRRNSTTAGTLITSSASLTLHTLFVTAANTTGDNNWYVEVHANTLAATYTLRADDHYSRPLTWDDGTVQDGTNALTAPDTVGGDYLYQIPTQLGAWGAWRSVLMVDSGEANLYVAQNSFPGLTATYRSEKAGSDATVLAPNEFNTNQTWYLRVRAQPNASWRIFSGDLFVKNLGTLAADASSGGTLRIGPEGAAWARTNVPPSTLAWRLDSPTGTTLYANNTSAPVPGKTSTYQMSGADQLLAVPDFLTSGQFLVAVAGPAGDIALDSRSQEIRLPVTQPTHTGDGFDFLLSATDDTGYGYLTYQIDVPINQIAWQVTTEPSGANAADVDVYLRRGKVPNEGDNSGMSEVTGLVADSVVQVPPTLSNGTWYVTVRGRPPFSFNLRSGNPEITDIAYVNEPTHVPNGAFHEGQAGWRYYRVLDIGSQNGTLGWILDLYGQVANTEIAVRRNGVPGRWQYRQNRETQIRTLGQVDGSSTSGFLERPNHSPDIWYVGVYQPTAALGAFELGTRQLIPDELDFNAGDIVVGPSGQPGQTSGRFRWFKATVPASALGWDLALDDVTSGQPRMVIRGDLVPETISNNPGNPYQASNWLSGYQWAPGYDITQRPYAPFVQGQSPVNLSGRRVQMGLGSPIRAGVYYIGVSDTWTTPTGVPMRYRIRSRGIGEGTAPGGAPWTLPVTTLPYVGGEATVTSPAREVSWFRVDVPAASDSFALELNTTSGEAMMAIERGHLPNSEAQINSTSEDNDILAAQRTKVGPEFFYKYPQGVNVQTIVPGIYYVAVASEGQSPNNTSYIGTGSSTWTLRSVGPMPITGGAQTMLSTDAPLSFTNQSLRYGEQKAYRFAVADGVSSMELKFKNVTGRPRMRIIKSTYPFPLPGQTYRAGEGGYTYDGDALYNETITVTAPTGVYTVLVAAQTNATSQEVPADYELEITARGQGIVAFNGGTADVIDQAPQTWRFFKIEVPADALGWDLRVANVQSGAPRLSIRRDALPDTQSSSYGNFSSANHWSSGEYWTPTYDLTQRPYAPFVQGQSPKNEQGRAVQMGMGAPLSPGTYYVGVIDSTSSSAGAPMSYTLVSRGIGQGNDANATPWAIQVVDVPFEGEATVTNLPAREVAYFKVVVPAGAKSFDCEVDTTSGEAMMAVAQGFIGNSDADVNDTSSPDSNRQGTRRQKNGPEFFYKLPLNGQTEIGGATYFISVASEGQSPQNTSYIGTGASSFTFKSKGELDVATAPAPIAPGTPATWPDQSLRYGEFKAYRFTPVANTPSVEVRIDDIVGRPYATIGGPPQPFPQPSGQNYRAVEGGYNNIGTTDGLLTLAGPSGTHTVLIQATLLSSVEASASYDFSVTSLGEEPLAFNGGAANVVAQPTRSWKYFRVVVPPEALGWDLRLVNITAGMPHLVVRRDLQPDDLSSSVGGFSTKTSWLTGERWYMSSDATGRPYAPFVQGQSPVNVGDGRILVAGMGAMLSPGSYVVGVIDSETTAGPAMTYTLRSRGIGIGNDPDGNPWGEQIQEIPWQDGSFTFNGVPARETRYVRVRVPDSVEAVGFALDALSGESLMAVRKGQVPNSDPDINADGDSDSSRQPVRRQKAGDEFFYRYVKTNEATLTPGDWYLALTSEGQDPYNTSYIGTGTSTFRVRSLGRMVPAGGITNIAGPGQVVRFDNQSLKYGEQRLYRFRVPDSVPAVEVRLANRVGNPRLTAGLKAFFSTTVPAPTSQSYRASVGGQTAVDSDEIAITTAGQSGDYTVVVYANRDAQSIERDAQFDLVITPRVINPLVWRGGTAPAELAARETAYFQLDVPNDCDGVPLAGWLVTAENTSGTYTIKARRDSLPGAPNGTTTFQAQDSQVVVAPPYFGPGRWYVSVESTTIAHVTLRSEEIDDRRHWTMPLAGVAPSTPGVTPPYFGDTGIDEAGLPINAGDRGIDLGAGRHHFYRVTVPPGNGGLLATYLEALSGNPDLYIRNGAAPTRNHGDQGQGGTIYDYSDTQANTTYGHLVATTARKGWALPPGEWWIAVYAPSSNVRYRLKTSVGVIEDLAFEGGTVNDALLSEGDMRHYRIQVPQSSVDQPSSTPTTWTINLKQEQGDAIVFLRELIPSGHTLQNLTPSSVTGNSQWADWTDDRTEVWGTGQLALPLVDNTGDKTINVPPVMPGMQYILSVYAKTATTFDLTSTPGPNRLKVDGLIDFKNGVVDVQLAPLEKRLYRVDIPANGARWMQDATLGTNVWIYAQLGTPPPATTSADKHNSGSGTPGNADWDIPLYYNWANQFNYPWMPGRSYYVMAENKDPSATRQFKLVMNGRDTSDDSDNDGLPDYWENKYFSGLSYTASADYDTDGLTNLQEFQRGTLPANPDSDADGLWDGLEVSLGSNPLSANSDGDITCDGDDSNPTDPNDSGEVLRLYLHKYTDGDYGKGFGSNRHNKTLRAVFTKTASVKAHWIHVVPWDIDADDEVGVYVNGVLVGNLGRTDDNAIGFPQMFWIDTVDLRTGDNFVELRQKTTGEVWGVRDLGLFTFGDPFGADSTGAYDTRHPDGFRLTWPKPVTTVFELRAFDIESQGEVEGTLDGARWFEAPASGNLAWSGYYQMPINGIDIGAAARVIEVRRRSGDADWQLRIVEQRTTLVNATYGMSGPATEDSHAYKAVNFLMGTTPADRELKVKYQAWPATTSVTTAGSVLKTATLPSSQQYATQELILCSKKDDIDTGRINFVQPPEATSPTFNVQITYYGVVLDSDSDLHDDCHDAFQRANDEWDDVDADGLGDNWEVRYFGNIAVANATDDQDGDGLVNLSEFGVTVGGRTDPACSDLDGDTFKGKSIWCTTGNDCDDHDVSFGSDALDKDCDRVATAIDCNDANAAVTNTKTNDADCDLIATNIDCNDANASVTNTKVNDADCDLIATDIDCDDTNPAVTTTSSNDGDCDGVATTLDCDDGNASVTNSRANDADCDLVATNIDCDDTNAAVTNSKVNDADCDLVATSIDCNDANAAVTNTKVNDADCDLVATSIDCNDANAAVTNTKVNDADCDLVATSIDCNDANAAVTNTKVDDADCDLVATSVDCNDGNAAITNTKVNDADCDLVATNVDCDDTNAAVTNSKVNDADCDLVATSIDCNDANAAVTNTKVNDADCDLVATSIDCNDANPAVTNTKTNDADCDLSPTGTDCDDHDPSVQVCAPTCVDGDGDGHPKPAADCAAGNDCDDTVAASTWRAVDADCDGVVTSDDCDDNNALETDSRVGDADCDGVGTAIDCDDANPLEKDTNVGDADCDGVATTVDCNDASSAVTATNVGDLDCDGVATGVDCDDSKATIKNTRTNDADCDLVATAVDCDDTKASVKNTRTNDADCDLVPKDLDCNDNDALVKNINTLDKDCDQVPTAVDCDDNDRFETHVTINDADCDLVLKTVDCNDNDPTNTRSKVGDADCDAVATAIDCNDASAAVTHTRTNDADCDLVASDIDCNDQNAAVKATRVGDADCDGVATGVDCDDGDAANTRSNVGDADCDALAAALDCDDGDPTVTHSSAGDADCDGVASGVDCDDTDPSVTATNVGDADCDGVTTAMDCDDHDASVTRTNDGDRDCDGVLDISDCDPGDATVATTNAGDKDCDGVATGLDCDDDDALVRDVRSANDGDCDGVSDPVDCAPGDRADDRSRAGDNDCDGVPSARDCDDRNPRETGVNDGDADCDGIATGVDCDDTDASNLSLRTGDADCDGAVAGDDCDDHDPTVQACPVCDDGDSDGHGGRSATCPKGDDCDDADEASTWRAVDGDCDGARTADDCDDADPASPLVADDADCDLVASADDCDDTDPLRGATASDGDCDGVVDGDDNCPTLANEDQADADHDDIGDVCEACALGEDSDGDGVKDACDVCPEERDADQADSDGDGIGDACDDSDGDGLLDVVDNCPLVDNVDQADRDGDDIGDACDSYEVGSAKESSGCSSGALGLGLVPLLGLWLCVRRRAGVLG